MNPRPIDVKPLDDYELLVTFQNGEKRIFDVKPMLSMPMYRPLKNKGFFALQKRMVCASIGMMTLTFALIRYMPALGLL